MEEREGLLNILWCIENCAGTIYHDLAVKEYQDILDLLDRDAELPAAPDKGGEDTVTETESTLDDGAHKVTCDICGFTYGEMWECCPDCLAPRPLSDKSDESQPAPAPCG